MFKYDNNHIKQAKKKYTIILRKKNLDTYKVHEKLNMNLNHSVLSNITEEALTKANTTKTLLSNNNNNNNNHSKIALTERNDYQIKKCSYIDFLELRKPKKPYPFGCTEKRFKWQNLKDESNVIYPEIHKKPQKKRHLLKETFGEGILGFLNNRQETDYRPRARPLKRCNSDMLSRLHNDDINITRRVIDPEFNKEKLKISRRRALSQFQALHHKTNGNIKSLFELTPIDIPIKGKKLFKSKSYGGLSINIFDNNYSKYDKPTKTKKLFLDNNCYYDSVKENNLVHNMDKCWKNKRKKSTEPRFSIYVYDLNQNMDALKLRNYGYYGKSKWNRTCTNKSLNKIKRDNKN